jgi:RimK family alpha-L-glutamate ligase
LNIGIVTRNRNSWNSTQLQEALARRKVSYECFSLPDLVAHVGCKPYLKANNTNIAEELDAQIIRPIGRGSIEELIFRMDALYRLQRLGLYIINPPEAIEHCVDKYDVLTILEENGLPVPRTAVTENTVEALESFKELGEDIILKPLFGSRGVGATRIKDTEIASTAFKTITFCHGVIYIQEFVPHGFSDIRAFVIGNRVAAAMRRVASGWKTNYSQGARPEPIELSETLEDMATKAARLVGCKVAGVDILESSKGPAIVEVNSQPGWKGLQSVTSVGIADEIVDFVLSELRK